MRHRLARRRHADGVCHSARNERGRNPSSTIVTMIDPEPDHCMALLLSDAVAAGAPAKRLN